MKRRSLSSAAMHTILVGGAILAGLTRVGSARADDDEPAVQIAPPEPTAPLPPLPPPAPIEPVKPAPLATTPPPSVPKAPCDEPCEDEKDKKDTRGSGYIGVRTQWTSARSAARDREATGVAFAGAFEVYNDERSMLASRTAMAFAIGGGSGGVEGLFGGALLVGARARVTPHHGPFVRLGLSGEYQGNSRYLYSRFDLPLGEVGYQFVEGATLFEIGGRLSPLLTGRLRTDGDQQVLGTAVSYGGFLAARGEIGRIDITYTRQTLGAAPFTPVVNTFQGRGCLSPIRYVVACLDGQILASAGGGAVYEPTVATLAGTIGFGAFGTKSRAKP